MRGQSAREVRHQIKRARVHHRIRKWRRRIFRIIIGTLATGVALYAIQSNDGLNISTLQGDGISAWNTVQNWINPDCQTYRRRLMKLDPKLAEQIKSLERQQDKLAEDSWGRMLFDNNVSWSDIQRMAKREEAIIERIGDIRNQRIENEIIINQGCPGAGPGYDYEMQ